MASKGSAPAPSAQTLLQHAEFLRRLARSLVGDASAADDVVQETMLRALERPPAHRENLRGWLGLVARNFALVRRRTEIRRDRRERMAAQTEARPSAREIAEPEPTRSGRRDTA